MRSRVLVVLLPLCSPAIVGSFFSCERIASPNEPPRTYFYDTATTRGSPPDFLTVDQWTFQWFSTDVDSDVKASYYRLLIGVPHDSALIAADPTPWIRSLDHRVPISFADPVTHPDGPYVFQAQSEDEYETFDEHPLTRDFVVSIQLAPVCSLVSRSEGHQGLPAAEFCFVAYKLNRLGRLVDSARFEFDFSWSRVSPDPITIRPFGGSYEGWTPQTDPNDWRVPTCIQFPELTSSHSYQLRVKARDVHYPDIESAPLTVPFEN